MKNSNLCLFYCKPYLEFVALIEVLIRSFCRICSNGSSFAWNSTKAGRFESAFFRVRVRVRVRVDFLEPIALLVNLSSKKLCFFYSPCFIVFFSWSIVFDFTFESPLFSLLNLQVESIYFKCESLNSVSFIR